MGSGTYSTANFTSAKATRTSSGLSEMGYTDDVLSKVAYKDRKVHPDLDPKGVKVRESRDSVDHPNALPISVWFDVTGSMQDIPRTVQAKLPTLLGLILLKGYTEDPQVQFAAIGDATCDGGPIQVGQFESDNRLDENIMNLWLEGGGGGSNEESYELAMYFMARHTATDSWEKRGRKGYMFLLGDETSYPKVKAKEVRDIIGDTQIAGDIAVEDILEELQEKWEVYMIIPTGGSSHGTSNKKFWNRLLGQYVLELDDNDAVAELIAATVGIAEGRDLGEIEKDLEELGTSPTAIAATTRAVSKLVPGRTTATGTSTGTLPDKKNLSRSRSGTSRL